MGYDDTTRRIILQFKNMSNIRFASWIADMIVSRFAGVYFDCVVPVPLHFFKRIWRGYNQSHLLAKMISNRIKCPDLNALTRTRFTKSQGSLNFNNRQKNVVRAFDVNKGYDLKNKTVLLVDDVYTTGATLEECANIIHRAGAKQIYACVGAKTWRV
jgi:competence protein ComFC